MLENKGKLEAKYVIHAPTMKPTAMQIGVRDVKLAMHGALECAEKLGVRSIAFLGMGPGVEASDLTNGCSHVIRS